MTATAPIAGHRTPVVTSPLNAPLVDAPFAKTIVELGHERPELVVVSADLSKYTDVAPFAQAFPERFFQVGMAEQNMMGIAGGLAKTGLVPVAVTYCVFATRRAGDQVQMALSTGPPHGRDRRLPARDNDAVPGQPPGQRRPRHHAGHPGDDRHRPDGRHRAVSRATRRGRRPRPGLPARPARPGAGDPGRRPRLRRRAPRGSCERAATSASSVPASAPAGRWRQPTCWRRRRSGGRAARARP